MAKGCAVVAGLLLSAITLMTCASLIGRNLLDVTLVGDFELTGVASGAAIALFLPWCQWQRGNIMVDFFTARAHARTNAALDRFGALLLGLCMALLAWRTGVGAVHAFETQSGTMLLGLPEWLVYAISAPALALTGVIGLWQAWQGDEPVSK